MRQAKGGRVKAYGDNRPNGRRATLRERLRATEEPQPMDSAQLNAVMRNAFAWMTIGLGVSAWVAAVLSASGLDALTIMTVLIITVILQFGLAFALYGELRWFSPKRASFCLVFYSVVVGLNTALFFSLVAYPEPSFKSVAICLSLASLYAVMTLIGWISKLDLSDHSSYVLMFFIGLPALAAVHHVSGRGGDGWVFSLIGVLLFSTLTAYMTEQIARLGAGAESTIQPDDALRFSVLAALKLFLSISRFSISVPLAIFMWLFSRRTAYYGGSDAGGFSPFGDDGGDDGGFFGDFGGGDGGGGGD